MVTNLYHLLKNWSVILMNSNKLGYLQIILVMVIWGSVGIIARLIPLSSKIIVFYRVLFAFITLIIYTLFKRDYKINTGGNIKLFLAGAGIFLALNWLFFFKAVKTTTIAAATISYYTSPIILTILAIWFLEERLTFKVIASLLSGFLGLFLILFSKGGLAGFPELLGIFYGFIAAIFYALFTLINKKISGLSSLDLTLVQSGIAVLVLFPFVIPLPFPDLKSFFLLILMGVFHTAFALIIYVSGLQKIKAQNVGVLSYIDPLSAVIFALVFLGEVPGYMTLVGGLLILGSGYFLVKK